jgi:hypothetical protein
MAPLRRIALRHGDTRGASYPHSSPIIPKRETPRQRFVFKL